jgi:predicted metal-dependent RNase
MKNTEMFDTYTQYNIAKNKLFSVLERTELRIKEASEKEKPFSKGLIQKLNKRSIELDYNEPFKPIENEVS